MAKLVALPPALPSELLNYILTYQSPISLIICQPRPAFLSSLIGSIDRPSARHEDPGDEADDSSVPEVPKHPLLIPTLRQIAASRLVNMAFINTVSHLRAYLAAFPGSAGEKGASIAETKPKNVVTEGISPMIVVYGLVGLHRDTSEWSAQGLGNSTAALVEVAWRMGQRVVVIEEKLDDGRDELGGVDERVWEERVPILNGNVRRAGLEDEDAVWSGRTVEVRRVLGRWFKFRKGELE